MLSQILASPLRPYSSQRRDWAIPNWRGWLSSGALAHRSTVSLRATPSNPKSTVQTVKATVHEAEPHCTSVPTVPRHRRSDRAMAPFPTINPRNIAWSWAR
jgi:hypothetical protein